MTQVMDSVQRALKKRAANVVREGKIAAGTARNPAIERRLIKWAEWVLSQQAECGGSGSMIAAVMDGGGVFVRSTAGGVNMPDDIYDTESAVQKIDEKYKQAVFQKYLELNRSDVQRASALGISRATFWRHLVAADQQILFCLKSPVRKASVRDEMLKRCQR